MKPSLRLLSLLVAALSFITVPASAACLRDQPNARTREQLEKVTGGAAVGQDLNDYAILFHDIRTPGCDSDGLMLQIFQKKLENQLAAGGFTGFLSGGITSFAYSTGIVLGAQGRLTPAIDQLLGDMPYTTSFDTGCGFTGFANGGPRWRLGNNCTDDFVVASQGYAWRAAYLSKTTGEERQARARQDRNAAIGYVNATLLDDDNSVCIYDPRNTLDGPKGPCNSDFDALLESQANGGPVEVLPINHQMENAAYGVGLVTSLAHTFVAFEVMGEPIRQEEYTSYERAAAVMRAWAEHGQRTIRDAAGDDASWTSQCFGADNLGRLSIVSRDKSCRDVIGYVLSMYPVANFYRENGFSLGNLDPNRYRYEGDHFPTGKFTRDGFIKFDDQFGFARYDVYYNVTWLWWHREPGQQGYPHRPNFDMPPFTPAACNKPDAAIIAPRQIESGQKNVTVSVRPQPGTTVTWEVFNSRDGDLNQIFGSGESFTFDTGCVANAHPPNDHVLVFSKVTNACGETASSSFTIAMNQPSALMRISELPVPGRTEQYPVFLTGLGPWVLTWEDGTTTTVEAPSEARPVVYTRTVQVQQGVRYAVTAVTSGAAPDRVCQGQVRVLAPGFLTTEPVAANPGEQTFFRASLRTWTGQPARGATLIFSVFNREIGRAVTDENGRAVISAVLQDLPGIYNGAIRVTFEGNDEVLGPASAAARLDIRCDAVTVTPSSFNLLDTNRTEVLTVLVGASGNCPWTPVSDSPWIHVDPAPQSGSKTFTITVDDLVGGGTRSGKVTVGLREIPITQSGSCTIQIVPEITLLPARGGLTALDVSAPEQCLWDVTGFPDWVSVVAATGQGTGTVRLNVQRNAEPNRKRTGDLTVSDRSNPSINAVAKLNQEAPPPETQPLLEQGIEGGTVVNRQNISMRLLHSGGPVTYTWFKNGVKFREGDDPSLANFTVGPGQNGYLAPGTGATYRVEASNTKGTISSSAFWFNEGEPGCFVPTIKNSTFGTNAWPDDQISPNPGARIPLFIDVDYGHVGGTRGAFKFQWYEGVSGDRRSPVFNGTTQDISVTPQQTSYYWVEVTEEGCGSNQSRTAEVLVARPPQKRRRAVSHDFNRDGMNDIPWHNKATGQTEIWTMNGSIHTGTLQSGTMSSELQSTGDFDGDERPDLVWRNPATGQNDIWIMNRWTPSHFEQLEARSGGNWTIGAVADFDDDNHHDVVWHNSATGANEIWFQDGTSHEGSWALPSTPSGSWGIHGTGDFNGDEKPDLFLHDAATGTNSVWLMNDAARASVQSESQFPATGKRTLRVQAQAVPAMSNADNVPMFVTDLNNDNRPDVVWRNTVTGQNSVWLMNGTSVMQTIELEPRTDLDWQIGGGGSGSSGGGGGSSDQRAATTLTVSASPAAFGSATIITATLSANGTGVAGRTLVFTVNGAEVTRLATDASGGAVAAASVIGIAPGTYANAVNVRFDGTSAYQPSQASADLVIERPEPVVSWSDPAPVVYGTPLSSTQLNATANVAGSFTYSPAAGTILDGGFNILEATFTPSDAALAPVTKSVVLEVTPATATVTWATPAPVAYGTALSSLQLNARTTAPGAFSYNPPAGTILGVGTHTLKATFVPTTPGNYGSVTANVTLQVIQGTQTISWTNPAAIIYGTPLSAAQLNATVAKSGSAPAGALTYSPAAGTILPAGTHTLTVTAAATPFYAAASKSVQLTVNRATAVIAWNAPAQIVYGTPLSATQLNASANVAGSFTYSPAAGTVLNAGTHTLTAQFTPADAANYNGTSKSVSLTVIKATPLLSWTAPAGITYGTPLSATQLNATANVAGSFTYSPAAGTILNAGTHTLSAQFTPADPANYESASTSTSLSVAKALQTLSWAPPAPIVYGTPLSSTQLNATVSVVGASPAGALTYSPAAGTVLQAGPAQVLTVSAAATPNYEPATLSVTIDVLKAKPVLTWATPAPIVYRTALSSAQLNATANVPGTFTYSPSSGTVLEAGMQPLSAHFTPADTRNYEEAGASVTLEVQQATPVITWTRPTGIVYGTALGATQLNATADVAGAFTYTPASGTILDAGDGQTLSVEYVPSDTRNFKNVSASVTIDVAKAPQTLSWAASAPIVYGTPLTSAQLNAQVSVVGPAAAGALVYSPAAGTVLDAGSRTLTVTALETANYLGATTSVPLQVDRAPLSLVVHAKSKLYGAAVPPLTGTLTGVQNNDPITPSYSTTGTLQSNTGTYPIAATLVDPANRLVNYDVTIVPSTLTVLPAPLQIAANPATSQYSDPLAQLGATFTGFVLGETPNDLAGTLLLTTTATPLSAPGTYPIAIGGHTSSNYAIVYVPSTYTVTQEDARVTITSPLFVTAPASKPATVTLSATVKDISATADAAGDMHGGDIRNATLTFVDRATGNVLCTAPIGLVSADDTRIGVATCTATGTFPPSLTVGASVAGHYLRNDAADDAVLTLSAPTADSVTGSGNLVVYGSPAKVNLNLKYDKSGVARGNFTLTFQRTVEGVVRKYEVSATTVDSLAIQRATAGGTAVITGTAVLRDVTTTTPVVLDAAAPLIAIASDNGEPSAADTVSIALLRKDGGFWLSVDWNGERTVPQAVQGGNVQIHQAK
jgi:hypothetical protein